MKIRPELHEAITSRSASGESHAQIATWLGGTHGVSVTSRAVGLLLERLRTEAKDRVTARLVDTVDKATTPATLKASRNGLRRLRRIVRKLETKIEDAIDGNAVDGAPGARPGAIPAGSVDAFFKLSVVLDKREDRMREVLGLGKDNEKKETPLSVLLIAELERERAERLAPPVGDDAEATP